MKWIEIAKAKPKFGESYLISDGDQIAIGHLLSTTQKPDGFEHKFSNTGSGDVSHIALITIPNQKEVTNG